MSNDLSTSSRLGRTIRSLISDGPKKKAFNEWMFGIAASQYDRATIALSMGQDRRWKRKLIEVLPNVENPSCVDLACGTGDITLLLAQRYSKGLFCGVDISEPMLEKARAKTTSKQIQFKCGDMCALPVESSTADIVTGSYALRNAGNLEKAIAEISRVLKPGGVAAFLDFSKSSGKLSQRIQYWVLKMWGSLWGIVFHLNPFVHGYIADSLNQFPEHHDLLVLFARHNLKPIFEQSYFFGCTKIIACQKAS